MKNLQLWRHRRTGSTFCRWFSSSNFGLWALGFGLWTPIKRPHLEAGPFYWLASRAGLPPSLTMENLQLWRDRRTSFTFCRWFSSGFSGVFLPLAPSPRRPLMIKPSRKAGLLVSGSLSWTVVGTTIQRFLSVSGKRLGRNLLICNHPKP
jgi:hypothetical protein